MLNELVDSVVSNIACLFTACIIRQLAVSGAVIHLHMHYCDVIMVAKASQITSLTIVYSIVHSGEDQRKHESSASLAFVWGIHRWPVNSPHKWPVMRKILPFDDVIIMSALVSQLDMAFSGHVIPDADLSGIEMYMEKIMMLSKTFTEKENT